MDYLQQISCFNLKKHSKGENGTKGSKGEPGPGCSMKEVRRINKRRKTIEQDLAAIRNKTQQLKTKYEKLKSDHEALRNLAYRFVGGRV